MRKINLGLPLLAILSCTYGLALAEQEVMTPYRRMYIARHERSLNTVFPSDANLADRLLPNGAVSSADMAVKIGRIYMIEAFGEQHMTEMGPLVAWYDEYTNEWVVEVTHSPGGTGREHMLRLAPKDGRITHIHGIPP